MGVMGWVLLSVGVAVGVAVTLLGGAVRDVLLDAVDAAACWWWDLVDTARRFLMLCGVLLLSGLAGWAVVALLIPRLAS